MTWWGWLLIGFVVGAAVVALLCSWARRAVAAPAPIPTPAQLAAEGKQIAGIAAAADPDPEKALRDLMRSKP